MIADNIKVVMLETSHPGNIGAAARAMKNMGLQRLALVNPAEFPSGRAVARASGATDILDKAEVHASLDAALADCSLVIGASARLRTVEWPQLDARQCGELAAREAQSQPVAILFGRESSGLTNDELARCNYLVHIPTNQEYQSLNIAAAIQVISYEIFVSSQAIPPPSQEEQLLENEGPASAERMQKYFQHLEETLVQLDFVKPAQSKTLLQRLRRVYNRARPTDTELHILHGVLSAAQGRKYLWMKDRLDLLMREVGVDNSVNSDKKD